jgi:hypothetical protein
MSFLRAVSTDLVEPEAEANRPGPARTINKECPDWFPGPRVNGCRRTKLLALELPALVQSSVEI